MELAKAWGCGAQWWVCLTGCLASRQAGSVDKIVDQPTHQRSCIIMIHRGRRMVDDAEFIKKLNVAWAAACSERFDHISPLLAERAKESLQRAIDISFRNSAGVIPDTLQLRFTHVGVW